MGDPQGAVYKVKGHAASDDLEHGRSSPLLQAGNEWADHFAKLGAQRHRLAPSELADWAAAWDNARALDIFLARGLQEVIRLQEQAGGGPALEDRPRPLSARAPRPAELVVDHHSWTAAGPGRPRPRMLPMPPDRFEQGSIRSVRPAALLPVRPQRAGFGAGRWTGARIPRAAGHRVWHVLVSAVRLLCRPSAPRARGAVRAANAQRR